MGTDESDVDIEDYFKNDPQSAETEGASKGEESKKSKYHRRWSDDSLDDNSTTSEGFYMTKRMEKIKDQKVERRYGRRAAERRIKAREHRRSRREEEAYYSAYGSYYDSYYNGFGFIYSSSYYGSFGSFRPRDVIVGPHGSLVAPPLSGSQSFGSFVGGPSLGSFGSFSGSFYGG